MAYSGPHGIGIGKCLGPNGLNSITVQLSPFNLTPNPGGEYKVWMAKVNDYVATPILLKGHLVLYQAEVRRIILKCSTAMMKIVGEICPQ